MLAEGADLQAAGVESAERVGYRIGHRIGYRFGKRALDLSACLLSLVVVLPVLAVCALAIAGTSMGWPFYLQDRVGQHGRAFRIWKLRTMVRNADRLGPALTQEHDPRVTRVGRWLRRWSLDELPQVFNILAGQMSLVGPRPELPSIVETYTPAQREVLLAKPGLTGWSQVNGRDSLGITQKLRLDRAYVEARTLWMDVKILAMTVPAVLSGDGIKR